MMGRVGISLGDITGIGPEVTLKALAAELGVKTGELIHPCRVAVSGKSAGPSLYHMLEVLGRDRVLARLRRAVDRSKK